MHRAVLTVCIFFQVGSTYACLFFYHITLLKVNDSPAPANCFKMTVCATDTDCWWARNDPLQMTSEPFTFLPLEHGLILCTSQHAGFTVWTREWLIGSSLLQNLQTAGKTTPGCRSLTNIGHAGTIVDRKAMIRSCANVRIQSTESQNADAMRRRPFLQMGQKLSSF